MLIYYFMFGSILFAYFATEYKTSFEQKNTENNRKVFCIVTFIILVLIMGLRGRYVGIDLPNYYYRYENTYSFWKSYEWEKGYSFLGYMFNDLLHFSFQLYLFSISAFMIIVVLYFSKKYSSNTMTSIIVYLTIGNFTINMSGLRQSIAMSITLLSIYYVEKRKIVPFLILVAVAFTIHNSAVGFLPVYCLWNIRITKRNAWRLFIATILIVPFRKIFSPIIRFFSPAKYQKYSLSENYSLNILVILVPVVICVYYLLYCDAEGEVIKQSESFCFILSLVSIMLLVLSNNLGLIGRLAYYYNYGLMIIAPAAVKHHRKIDMKLGTLIGGMMIVLFMMYFFISTPGGTLQIDNYHFYWQ